MRVALARSRPRRPHQNHRGEGRTPSLRTGGTSADHNGGPGEVVEHPATAHSHRSSQRPPQTGRGRGEGQGVQDEPVTKLQVLRACLLFARPPPLSGNRPATAGMARICRHKQPMRRGYHLPPCRELSRTMPVTSGPGFVWRSQCRYPPGSSLQASPLGSPGFSCLRAGVPSPPPGASCAGNLGHL